MRIPISCPTLIACIALAVTSVRERRAADGLLVIRSAQTGRVRIGNGGPIHSLRTLNGDIHVRTNND